MTGIDRHRCEVAGCGKTFSRSDHLARHNVNHAPRVMYRCGVIGCEKVFVRKDVKEKHEVRHRRKLGKLKSREERRRHSSAEIHPINQFSDGASSGDEEVKNGAQVSTNMIENNGDVAIGLNGAKNLDNSPESQFFASDVPFSQELAMKPQVSNLNSVTGASIESDFIPTTTFLPTDLTQWLFNDEAFLNQKSSPTDDFLHELDINAEKMLQDAFCIPPNFSPANQTNISDEIIFKLISLIPELSNKHFGIAQIERCLEIYWSICQVQFPILHKPSFSTQKAHPLLLLGLIMVGAGLAKMTGFDESHIFPNNSDQDLADTIAVPLRGLIISSDECCSPPKAWIIQVLIILEIYEILLSTRKLHQRAYLHHGLKIQLLRRSPLLGGDPLNQSNDYKELTEGADVWKSWIELESLKRAALASFYLDTIHATIYGHEIVLFAHQIKLSMPCDDMVWEMSNIDENNFPPQAETPRFVNALTKLLHQEKFEVSSFSKKILLAGLLTIKVQMEQKDLEVTFLDWKPVKESWKDTLSQAIDVWRDDICHKNCCDSRNCFYMSNKPTSEAIPASFSGEDTTCKFPIYHLSQAFMQIKQYDCIIYAGASKRMDVKTTGRDFKAVNQRIQSWANSFRGRNSALHCYMFLNEMLFRGKETLYYNAAMDPLFHRPNIVASILFVLWAFNYSLEGPESTIFKKTTNKPPKYKEEGYTYLRRVIGALNLGRGQMNVSDESLNDALARIEHKNYLAGFLSLFVDGFRASQSEVCREYGELLQNCIERSLGKRYMPVG